MIYVKKYNRWVTKDGLVFRYSKNLDKLVLCKQSTTNLGYKLVSVYGDYIRQILVHRLIWEAFNSDIPSDLEIDHIDTNKDNNALSNLKLVSHRENMNNPITKSNRTGQKRCPYKTCKERKPYKTGKVSSYFGTKFREHFGIRKKDNENLYRKEQMYYLRHKVLRWEIEK